MTNKKSISAYPIDETPISKHGDRYVMRCRKDDEEDRFIDVEIGGLDELRALGDTVRRWVRKAPS